MISKKLVSVLAVALFGFGLAGCGSDNDTKDSSAASTEKTTETTEAEVVTSASISDDPAVLEKALSADGTWIIAATADVTFDKDVTVAGEFHNKADNSEDIYRKLALYSQDDKRNVTAEYTMTVPQLVVESENFNIVHGTIEGDILVKANGFVLNGAKVTGNIVFETQEFKDSATLEEDGATVEGEVSVN